MEGGEANELEDDPPTTFGRGDLPCLVTEANSTHGIGEDAANTLNPAVDL